VKVKHITIKPNMNNMKKIRKAFLKSDADALFLQAEYVTLPKDGIEKLAMQIQGNIQCISGWVPASEAGAWNALKLVGDNTIAHIIHAYPGVTIADYTSPECFLVSRKIIEEVPFNFKKVKELRWVTGFKIITNAFMNFCNDIYEAGYTIYMNGDVICKRKFPPLPKDINDPPIVSKKDKIVVMFTIDNNYVIPLAVALKSLIDSFPNDRELKVIVGDVGINQYNKDKLNEIYPIEFIKIDTSRIKNIKINIVYHTSAIFARLILVEMLDIDKILYLDPDIIIKDDVSKLWDLDVSNYVLAAAQDDTIPERDGYVYFNSGVMLINLKKWKERKITRKAIKYVTKNITNHTDQDALNNILKGDYLRFSKKWNSNPISGKRDGLRIMHFLGSEKPWWYGSKMSIVPEYFKIVDKTPFNGWRPSAPQKEIIIV
jgi:lipopolysaccharide biosynthesis glycosyltransferase